MSRFPFTLHQGKDGGGRGGGAMTKRCSVPGSGGKEGRGGSFGRGGGRLGIRGGGVWVVVGWWGCGGVEGRGWKG